MPKVRAQLDYKLNRISLTAAGFSALSALSAITNSIPLGPLRLLVLIELSLSSLPRGPILLLLHPISHISGALALETWPLTCRAWLGSWRRVLILHRTSKVSQSLLHVPSCFRHLIFHTAEAAIGEAEKSPGFSISLLQIVATEGYGATARLASALYFKNYIKRNWTVGFQHFAFWFWLLMHLRLLQDENGNHKLPQNEVSAIKQDLIRLMISVPPNIQYQLGDAIGVIADSDFWERWNTLVDVRTNHAS